MPDVLDGAALILAEDAAVRDSLTLLLEIYGLRPTAYPGTAECLHDQRAANESRVLVTFQNTAARGIEVVNSLRRLGMTQPAIILAVRIAAARHTRGRASWRGNFRVAG